MSKLKEFTYYQNSMTRWFNIAGPCSDDIHYMLSPTVRLPDLEELIPAILILKRFCVVSAI